MATTLNIVLMIDTATNTVDASINVPIGPDAIAISPNGNYAYVASNVGSSPGSVSVIDISPN
ncbi:MAG: hypothetical protein JO077_08395 [Verrucomicrobia bacterium]|nr:hypothetical protein [Verrucomicrobiota bacterium]